MGRFDDLILTTLEELALESMSFTDTILEQTFAGVLRTGVGEHRCS